MDNTVALTGENLRNENGGRNGDGDDSPPLCRRYNLALMPEQSVLYFHGFASSPLGRKVEALTKILAPDRITLNAPDLNVPSFERLDYEAMVREGLRAGRSRPPQAVVGSSLGALVALGVLQQGVRAPLVLIAPALGVTSRWHERIGSADPVMVYNFALDRESPIHRAFFDQMARVTVDEQPPPVPVTIVMGSHDESVPIERVKAVWEKWENSGALRAGSRFIEIADGDHGLTSFVDIIAEEIRRAVSSK